MVNILIKPDVLDSEIQRKNRCIEKANVGDQETIHDNINSVCEPWSGQPSRFFFFMINDRTYCGQKLLSPLVMQYGCASLFCSQIKVEMILGYFLRTQTSETGVEIFYKDISAKTRHVLFSELMKNRFIDIYFPYVHLGSKNKMEIASPANGWTVDDHFENLLNWGELEQRKITLDFLAADNVQSSPVIYDPACSTGQFLSLIKKAIPNAMTIGQDLSRDMCDRATPLLDKVIHGDAMCPGVSSASCDYIFFRFLNAEVVSTPMATRLFEAIIPCLKVTGKAIIFGFTPVLIALPYLMQHGFTIHGCNAALPEQGVIIQYYIIGRPCIASQFF